MGQSNIDIKHNADIHLTAVLPLVEIFPQELGYLRIDLGFREFAQQYWEIFKTENE